MNHFRPKEVLHRAQKSEKDGQKREAAKDYALLSVYLRKKNKFSDAEKMISRAIALTPDSGRLYLEEAACLFELKEELRAEESLQKCIQIGFERKQIQVYLEHLDKHLQSFTYLREKFFRLWLSIDRTSSVPFLKLAEVLVDQSNWAEAKQQLLRGLRLEPYQPELLSLLEKILEEHGNPTEKEYYDRFREKKLSYDELSILLGAPKKEKTTQTSATSVKENSPDLKELGDLVKELERELELDSESEFENIEPVIQEFLRKSNQVIGSDLQARLDLATAFFEMRRFREAKLELNQISPEHLLYGQAQYLLGNILVEEGSEVAALGAFQTALRTAVKESFFWKETLYQLIKINLKLGDQLNARKHIEQLEKAEPNYRDLKNLRKNLKADTK